MPLEYGPRKGFNYEKSYNPRGRDKPDTHKIIDSDVGRVPVYHTDSFVNSFIGNELDPGAFHEEVDAIKAERLAGIVNSEKSMI